jgi:geranylgeranyl transferase type-2 subunit beta
MPQPPAAPYLLRLAERLNRGARLWPDERRSRHRDYLHRLQRSDGGYAGREGDSDLYYTSFAVRGLMLVDGLDELRIERFGNFLRTFDLFRLNVIDQMNWLATAAAFQAAGGSDLTQELPAEWEDQLLAGFEQLRRPDGGYAKSPEGATGGTYHSFLIALTCELLGREIPRPNRLVQFLYDRQREDGGFVEIGPMRNSGTNPTAAACAILQILGQITPDVCSDVAAFLKDVRSDEGAFQANRRIPFADILSTFTAVLTCLDLGLPDLISRPALEGFLLNQMEFPTGGFRAAMWDEATDVEYTFYGLGTLALLSELPSPAAPS